MKWKSLTTKSTVDMVEHVKDYIKENPNVEVLVGTDSQNHKSKTDYAIVVALHTNRGSHILYCKETFPRFNDRFTRLLKEVEYTINVGDKLRKAGINPKKIRLHFDLNEDPKYKSNEVLRTAMGWGQGLGFECQHKPTAFAASYAADMLLK